MYMLFKHSYYTLQANDKHKYNNEKKRGSKWGEGGVCVCGGGGCSEVQDHSHIYFFRIFMLYYS